MLVQCVVKPFLASSLTLSLVYRFSGLIVGLEFDLCWTILACWKLFSEITKVLQCCCVSSP